MEDRARRWLLALLIALTSGLGLLAGRLAVGGVDEATALALSGLTSACLLTCLALGGALMTREAPRAALLLGPGSHPLGPRGLLLAAAGLLGASQLADLALEATGARAASQLGLIDRILASADRDALALALVGVVLAPAFAEELLFRGLLQRGLSRRLGALPALGLSALLFGAAHMDLVHGAGALLLGLYLGGLTLVTGSIWPAAACHALNNLLALASAAALHREWPSWLDAVGHAFLATCLIALVLALRRFFALLPDAVARWQRALEDQPADESDTDPSGVG